MLFIRFVIVGAAGFFIDTGLLLLLVHWGVNPYAGRLCSFTIAATCTWLMNRSFTFKSSHQLTTREWRHYLGVMALGALVNNITYALMIWLVGYGYWQYISGIALGSLLALGVNFIGSKRLYQNYTR